MNRNITPGWKIVRTSAIEALSLYVLFYVFFISDYSWRLHLNFVCVQLTGWVAHLFIDKTFPGFVPTADSYWAYLASAVFFCLAIIAALLWSIINKGKRLIVLYDFTCVIARYFVAFELLYYGIEKLDGIQFTISTERLIPSVGASDPFNLYWITTGASQSYAFFGGLLETIAAILLLFRRTTTLGCLIAIPVLVNVLFINIGYDVFIKLKVFHLLFFCIFLLLPDLDKLIRFFILKQNASLSLSPPSLFKGKALWVQYALKFLLISYMLTSIILDEIQYYRQTRHSAHQQLIGIFNIRDYQVMDSSYGINTADSLKWKKMAISTVNGIRIQQLNDSIADFDYKADTLNKIIEMTAWTDTSIKAKLHYVEKQPGEWHFDGTYKSGHIRFSSSKIDIYSVPLLKNRGKMRWTYD